MREVPINIGLIGYGYWGVNIARTLYGMQEFNLVSISDLQEDRRFFAQKEYPSVKIYDSYVNQIKGNNIDAVIVASPVAYHFEIVKACILSGLHVLCEKVLSVHNSEIVELEELAFKNNKILDVGFTFLHNNVIKAMQSELESNSCGNIFYVTFKRTGLGPIRKDVDAITDLCPHDISIVLKWFGIPEWVIASSICTSNANRADVAFIQLGFDTFKVNIHCSWLTPIKQRTIEVVGKMGMMIFDDIGVEKLKIIKPQKEYYKDVNDFGSFQLKISSGDIIIPNIDYSQPLQIEFKEFKKLIDTGTKSTMLKMSKDVSIVLDAIKESLVQDSKKIFL